MSCLPISPVTSRKEKNLREGAAADRASRIAKLIAVGWISSEAEIPDDAIPVDPDLINLGGSYFHPTHFQAVQFRCSDCGVPQTWAAEDQRWYYETTGAPYYSTATRCRGCRKKDQNRKNPAGFSPGHAKPNA